jgi:hypothetical protein
MIKIIDTPFHSDRMRRNSPPQPFLYEAVSQYENTAFRKWGEAVGG